MRVAMLTLLLCCGCATGEYVRVVRVVDGDTFIIDEQGLPVTVRLVGQQGEFIDAFETRRGRRLTAQAVAAGISEDEALARGLDEAQRLRERTEGRRIRVKYVGYPTDRYGRRLAAIAE